MTFVSLSTNSGDTHSHFLVTRDHADVFVFDLPTRDKLLPRPELVLLPARKVKIFIKQDDGAGLDAICQLIQHIPGAGIEIAVNVQERHWFGVCGQETGQGLVKPANNQFAVCSHARQGLLEMIFAYVPGPVFGQALEAVKAIHSFMW